MEFSFWQKRIAVIHAIVMFSYMLALTVFLGFFIPDWVNKQVNKIIG